VIARLVFVILLLPVTARADEVAGGDRKAAERYYRAGDKAYKQQNFSAAAQNFEEAYKQYPIPEIAFSTAQAYRRWYRVEPKLESAKRALELYRVYLGKVKTGGRVGAAGDYVGEMEREVDKLVAAGAKAVTVAVVERTRLGISPQLEVEKQSLQELVDLPDTTSVKIVTLMDGKPVPPFEMVDVEPGPHKVHVEAEGYLPSDTIEYAGKGASQFAEVVLQPRPAKVTVETTEGAGIKVDGRPAGVAPMAALELSAGKHVITISRAGRHSVAREIEVTRGQVMTLREPLDKTTRRRAVPVVAGVAGVLTVATITSVIYAFVLDGRASDQLAAIERGDQTPETADAYESNVLMRDRVKLGTYITGGAALAVGAAAAALYWLDNPSDEVRVAPTISSGGAGVSIGGRF
jgi:hypothetical protein